MDPVLNPYTPGAGVSPPELVGRDALLDKASIALQRIALGRFGKSLILTGLRGVGKTAVLNRIRQSAEVEKLITVRIEAPEGRSLPSLLVPGLNAALVKLSLGRATSKIATQAFKALLSFVSAMKLKYNDVELALDLDLDPDLRSSPLHKNSLAPDLDHELLSLFQAVGALAKDRETALVLFIDELQILDEKELASLIMALHMAAQDALPITLVGAGLPQILAKMGQAKTYAERLFDFIELGPLDSDFAIQALVIPAKKLGVVYEPGALAEILKQTQGYPYFLQEWGKNIWDLAESSPITQKDSKRATKQAIADLDASFFRVRFDQLNTSQKDYLRAMAELESESGSESGSKSGLIGSGKIAEVLGKKVTALGSIREQLIAKGLIYSPAHGQTAFTVPLFGGFMRRVMSA